MREFFYVARVGCSAVFDFEGLNLQNRLETLVFPSDGFWASSPRLRKLRVEN
ncbi:hypothetical protein CCP2SC5_160025 [Azospirillaceae bacterium]